jgi:hypothetical protein
MSSCTVQNQPICQWQAPTKFDFVTNLKTAKALGLSLLKTRFERIDGAAR